MIAQAVLEKRVSLLEATRRAGVMPQHTAVEMASELGIILDPWQRDVLTSAKRELLMLASRQSGKSTVAALMALHQTVYQPGSLVLIISPGERQSQLLLRMYRRFFRRLPDAPAAVVENVLSMELANGSQVYALPGSEATVRGFSSVALIIEDEAAIVPDDLYQATRPMTAVSGGRIVLLSTPRGKRGHFYHEYTQGGDGWHRATVTAHDCPRIDPAWLSEERARVGDYWFSQEYLCQFRDTDDQLYGSDLVDAAISADIQPLALPAMQWSAA